MPPLAYILRPEKIEDFVGQKQIAGPGSWLNRAIKKDGLTSMVFFGPPGSGKTTLAQIIAKSTKSNFIVVNAVMGTTRELKEHLKEAEKTGQKTIIFIDEIHRFNKAQQDVLLPFVERGDIVLIGATTENPSFTVISPLISRSKVLVFNRLEKEDLEKILNRALKNYPRVKFDKEAREILISESNGDARILLNAFEDLISQTKSVTKKTIEKSNILKVLKYDKTGEEHYNIISALHKSMRDSDPDAALYWMMRMLEAGEDPLYVARRLIRFASEDIGIADPHALLVATSAYDACHFIGMPECDVILAQAAVHLSLSPKSNSLYRAVQSTRSDIRQFGNLDVPMNLRNAPTKLMKQMGYGKNYKYAHEYKDAKIDQQHLPDELKGKKYYFPTERGLEKKVSDRLDKRSPA